MNTHISKELAQWLKERGCEIESSKWLRWERRMVCPNKDCAFPSYSTMQPKICEKCKSSCVEKSAHFTVENDAPFYPDTQGGVRLYSWYDLLVTHAKEFWGEAEVYCIDPQHRGHTEVLLRLLREGEIPEAEAYVREHSLFSTLPIKK